MINTHGRQRPWTVAKKERPQPQPQPEQELPRKRMTGDEREAFVQIVAATDIMIKQKDALAARMRIIPGGARDFGLIAAKLLALYKKMLKTIPDDQLKTYSHSIPNMAYSVGTKKVASASNRSEYGMWISFEALEPIFETVHEHCMMCMKDPQEQRQCPLAKALDTLPSDKKDAAPGCGYFGVV